MTTDFRALCSRMADELDYYRQLLKDDRHEVHQLATEARAALAEPQPEGPSLEEVEDLCEEHCFNVEGYESIECLQGLINDALARYGRQPTPPAAGEVAEWPTDEELMKLLPEDMHKELAYWSRIYAEQAGIKPGLFRVILNTHTVDFARAVLARWGTPN